MKSGFFFLFIESVYPTHLCLVFFWFFGLFFRESVEIRGTDLFSPSYFWFYLKPSFVFLVKKVGNRWPTSSPVFYSCFLFSFYSSFIPFFLLFFFLKPRGCKRKEPVSNFYILFIYLSGLLCTWQILVYTYRLLSIHLFFSYYNRGDCSKTSRCPIFSFNFFFSGFFALDRFLYLNMDWQIKNGEWGKYYPVPGVCLREIYSLLHMDLWVYV